MSDIHYVTVLHHKDGTREEVVLPASLPEALARLIGEYALLEMGPEVKSFEVLERPAEPAPAAPQARAAPLSWLAPKQLARFLGVSRQTVHRWWRAGKLPPPARFSNHDLRWQREDVEAHLQRLAQRA